MLRSAKKRHAENQDEKLKPEYVAVRSWKRISNSQRWTDFHGKWHLSQLLPNSSESCLFLLCIFPISSSPVWWRCQIQTAPQSTEQKDENQPHTHQPTAGQGWMPHSSWLQAPGLSLDVAARMYCTWKAWDSRKQMGCNAKAKSPREFGTNFHI